MQNKSQIDEFFQFICERYRILQRRKQGLPPPWTEDEILQKYRFTNVHREEDTVTKWISDNWRTPNAKDPLLPFAMCVARIFNLPETLELIGYPVPWRGARLEKLLIKHRDAGCKLFGHAYLLTTSGERVKKVEYTFNRILNPLWKKKGKLVFRKGDRLEDLFNRLTTCAGFATFKAAQVIADVKFCKPWNDCDDFWTFAAPGPGSRRGLNRIIGNDYKAHWVDEDWKKELACLQWQIDPLIRKAGIPRLSASDLQNCLCEWDKYQRSLLGQGRPKQLFRPVMHIEPELFSQK